MDTLYINQSINQNVAFMVLKTTGTISRFKRKNWFDKGPNIAWDIDWNMFLADGLVWLTKSKNNFVYTLGQIASFFIVPVVLSTMKVTLWVGKNEKKMAIYLQNGQKKGICGNIWADSAKWVFIWVFVETSHTQWYNSSCIHVVGI